MTDNKFDGLRQVGLLAEPVGHPALPDAPNFISIDPDDAMPYIPDSRDPELQPVVRLVGLGLVVVACEPHLVNPRNFLIEQLCRSVSKGDDFLGHPTNACKVLLASPECYDVQERGILPVEVDLRSCPKPIPAPDDGQDKQLRSWQREWLGGGHGMVVLGPWDNLRRSVKEWFEYQLGYHPKNDESARKTVFDDHEKWLVRMLKEHARVQGMTIVVWHELNGHADRLGKTVGLHEAHCQIWLRKRKARYALVVPEYSRNQAGPACTIDLDRDDDGWFHPVAETAAAKLTAVKPKSSKGCQHPVDKQIKEFLAANPGRHTLRQIVEGCGAVWPDSKARFNDALQRRLVKAGHVIRHEPDVDGGRSAITYSLRQ